MRGTRRLSEHQLLLRCQLGDEGAWRCVVERYERLVYSIPLQHGLSASDAADVAQATFSALLRGLVGIEEPERLASWLGTVARRESQRLMNRTRRAVPVAQVADRADDDSATQRIDDMIWLENGLARLDDRCRRLLSALYLDPREPSYARIADELQLPIGSIGPTRARCLEKLHKLLGSPP